MIPPPTPKNPIPEVLPEGVELRDPGDFGSLRGSIYNGMKEEMAAAFPLSYGGVRLELGDVDYEDPDDIDNNAQKEALLTGKFLARRLRGTFRLFDEKTGDLLEERRTTLMRVPHLTDRGTFMHNGSEYTSMAQARLLPGVYTRKKSNGEFNTHFNVARGTGNSFYVRLEPETALYKLDIGQSQLRLYSLLHDIGVSDEELERSWGPEVLEANKKAYDPRVLDKAYARLVKKAKPEASREEKIEAIKQAFESMRINKRVAQKNLPNLFDRTKAAAWAEAGREWQKQAGQRAVANLAQELAADGDLSIQDLREIAGELNARYGAEIDLGWSKADLQREIHAFVDDSDAPELADLRTSVKTAAVYFQVPPVRRAETLRPKPASHVPALVPVVNTSLTEQDFVRFIWEQENAERRGFNAKTATWRTYDDGGIPAVGPGVQVSHHGTYSNAWVMARFQRALDQSEKRATARYEAVYGPGTFRKLAKQDQFILRDFAYSGVHAPKLQEALTKRAHEDILTEIKRFTKKAGRKVPLTRRNDALLQATYPELQKQASRAPAWLSHAFVKIAARKGAVCMLPLGDGQYLLERNDEESDEPGKLRPPGGGAEKSDKDLEATIIRELGEEFGLSEETIRDKVKLLGYETREKHRGAAVFELKDHGLKAGLYQASNDPDERVLLEEGSLDDPDYVGPVLENLSRDPL